MAKLLRDVKVFFTKDINLERKGSPISPSTWTKANERILCYLGFCRDTLHYKDISPDLFLRTRLLERYLDYLKTDRKLASSTLANHAASLIYPAKFLNREHAVTLYRDVKVVSQLRGACNAFQRQARAAQPTQEDLSMQISGCHDGTLMFRFEDYKTYGSHGVDVTNLPEDHRLNVIIREYLDKYRDILLDASDDGTTNNFLLLTDKGKPFSGPAFSTHMKSVFYHLTGVSVNLHLLRSSFVTYCYGDSQCTDAMKDSSASALRHTRKQAQLTYDRRNSSEKKSLAVSLASELAENTIESLSAQPSDRNAGLDKGSWVALTVEGSTLANPNILLARIQNLMPGRKASLLWFKATAEKGLYAFHYDEASWIEGLDALVPVQVKEIKNSPGLYKLTTSLKKIHRAVLGNN
ncbi:predicted protein [Nematostella vectensis]|uniref:Uncharacterized protein n=1 Tax=Nematostella vectensis TaxID=45351 RepID=A7T6Z9_NEMVE|nr:predicted protein [Nematostella vectensis]|eukprot:XP_001620355.1 hypothetical protein NEMVEDRAFT_v1g223199 [Nematostella vectensis]